LLSVEDGRLSLTGQIFEHIRLKQRLVELSALVVAHLAERRVADDLSDAPAELRARQWEKLADTVTRCVRAREWRCWPRSYTNVVHRAPLVDTDDA
jgi:hypothetical protein